jgi:hypothetical protein
VTTSDEKSVGALLAEAHALESWAGGRLTWAVVLRRAQAGALRSAANDLRAAAAKVDEAASLLENSGRRRQ